MIRRAASRTSRALATLQLSSPSLATEQQLSRVTLSTYRLLDPRQRSDRQSRAHVGRIRPGVLQSAGRASFSEHRERDGQPSANSESAGDGNEGSVAAGLSSSVAATPRKRVLDNTNDLPPVTDQAFEAPFVPSASHQSIWERLLHHAQRPGAVMLLIVVLILAAIGVWYWGHTMAQVPKDRFYQSERDSSR